jgi:integrase
MAGRASTISPQLRASEIARAYGFTSRYWIRLAAAGKVPGAWQPSGPGGGWLFDHAEFAAWRQASKRRTTRWRQSTGEAKGIGPGPNGKGREYRRSLATTNRAIAERRFREWLEELDAIAYGDKPRRFWEEASDRFIREHLPTIKRSAAIRYGVSLIHLDEHFAGKMLHQITSAEMSEFEAKRRAQGVSTSTIRRDLACLSSLLTSAQDWEWIEDNPVPVFLRRRAKRGLKEGEARTRYLTEEEERRLLEAASPAVRWAIMLAIDTGLRREELFGLVWVQVDLLRGLIDTTRRTKSGRSRKVPIPLRSAQILAHIPRNLESPHVLVNPDTGERYVQMNKGLKAACRRAGLKDVQWHDLRRTAGCRWLQRDGKSMEEISLLLGHSSVRVTEKSYAFLEAETVAESLAGRTKAGTGTAESIPIVKVRQ